jgi:hypothetical protein
MRPKELLLTIKYPTLWLFVFLVASSIIVFLLPAGKFFAMQFDGTNFVLDFFVGLIFPIGVLTPFVVGTLVNSSVTNIFAVAPIIGFGAMVMDLFIFSLIKKLFSKDFAKSKSGKQLIELKGFFADAWVGKKIVNYVTFAFSGLIAAAPLPKDTARNLIIILSSMSFLELAIISFLANTGAVLFFLFL